MQGRQKVSQKVSKKEDFDDKYAQENSNVSFNNLEEKYKLRLQNDSPSMRVSRSEHSICSPQDFDFHPLSNMISKGQNIFHNLVVRMNVKKFRDRLQGMRFHQRQLTYSHYKAIGDKSCNIDIAPPDRNFTKDDPYMKIHVGAFFFKQLRRKVHYLLQYIISSRVYLKVSTTLYNINRMIPVFHPESDRNILWQILTFVCTLTFLVLIPIDLAFNNHILSEQFYYFTVVGSTILLANMLAELNTGYLDYGHFIKDRTKIIMHHLRSGVFVDLISILTVLIISINRHQQIGTSHFVHQEWANSLMLIFGSQFRHIFIQKRTFDEQMNWSIYNRTLYNICVILLTVVYIQHCFSCVWSYIGLKETELDQASWISYYKLQNSPWTEQYLNSLYYTIVTFSSVGYGDLTPKTNTEKIFSIFFLLVSSLQLSYTLTRIGRLLEELNQISSQTVKRMRVINNYMNRLGISLKLKHQVRDYLRMYWTQRQEFDEHDYREIIKDLSDNLRDQLMLETTQTMIHKIEFFEKTFSRWINIELSQYIEQVNMNPEYLIPLHHVNDPSNTYLYFVDHGHVEEVIIMNVKSDPIQTKKIYRSGQYFGLNGFICGQTSEDHFKTKGFCKLFRIQRNNLIHILKDYPLDYEKFCQWRDQLNLGLIHTLEKQPCIYCRKDCNSMNDCRSLHFIPDRERIIKSLRFESKNQTRTPRQRKGIQKSNSLFYQKIYEEKAEIYIKSNVNPYEIIYDDIGEEDLQSSPRTPKTIHNQSEKLTHAGQRAVQKVFAGLRLKKHLDKVSHNQYELLRDQCTFLTYFTEENQRQQLLWCKRIRRLLTSYHVQLSQHFPEQDIQQMQIILLTLQNSDPYKLNVELDHYQNFDEYLPHNNINQILPNLTTQIKPSRFLGYMLYPYLYNVQYLNASLQKKSTFKNDSNNTKIDFPLRKIKSSARSRF